MTAQVLIVEDDPHFSGILKEVLSGEGFITILKDRADSALLATRRHKPDLLLVDVSLPGGRSGLDLVKEIRRNPVTANIPVILMSAVHSRQNPKVEQAMKALGVTRFLPKPFSVLDLPNHVREVLAQREEQTNSETSKTNGQTRRPIQASFALLTRIWTDASSGVLRIPGVDDWVTFSDGDLVDSTAASLVEEAFYRRDITFHEMDVSIGKPVETFASLLMDAATGLAEPDRIRKALSRRVTQGRRFARSRQLPLSEETKKLLAAADGRKSLHTLFSTGVPPSDQIYKELSVLTLLGLIHLEPPARPQTKPLPMRPGAKARRRTARSVTPAHTSATPNRAPDAVDPRLIRLSKELNRLRDADDWTLIGLPPNAEASVIEQTVERMHDRYQQILLDPTACHDTMRVAKELEALVLDAATRILAGNARTPVVQTPPRSEMNEEELAFRAGQAALEGEQWAHAVKCFTAARNVQIDSPRNLAWLGWAIYCDPEREGRIESSMEHLQLAVSLDPNFVEGQFFLSTIEAAVDEPRRARIRLEHLLRQDPDHTAARALLAKLPAASEPSEP